MTCYMMKPIISNTIKPVLNDHIKQDIFLAFQSQVVAYCCMLQELSATFIQQ